MHWPPQTPSMQPNIQLTQQTPNRCFLSSAYYPVPLHPYLLATWFNASSDWFMSPTLCCITLPCLLPSSGIPLNTTTTQASKPPCNMHLTNFGLLMKIFNLIMSISPPKTTQTSQMACLLVTQPAETTDHFPPIASCAQACSQAMVRQ